MMSLLRNAAVTGLCLVAMLASCDGSLAQDLPSAPVQQGRPELSGQELNGKIELLTRSLEQTQTELARSRTEIEQLRAMLGEVLKRMNATAAVAQQDANRATGIASGVAAAEQASSLLHPPAREVGHWRLVEVMTEALRQHRA